MPDSRDQSITSEWGKLNQGQRWGVIATDLDRAFAMLKPALTHYEAIVIQAIRERSWGTSTRRKLPGDPWPDAQLCMISMGELAREIDPSDPSLWKRLKEARSRLKKHRIIEERNGGLWINKNVNTWKRLTPEAIAYAAKARTRREPEGSGLTGPEVRAGGARKSGPGEPEGSGRGSPKVRAGGARKSGPLHIEDRAREDLQKIKKTPPVGESAQSARACEAGDEPFAGSDPDTLPKITGPGKASAEAEALARWATVLGGDYSFWAKESCELAPAAWVRAILERKVFGHPRRPSIPLLAKILADCRAARHCEFEGSAPVSSANGQHVPPSRAELRRQAIKDSLKDVPPDFFRGIPGVPDPVIDEEIQG